MKILLDECVPRRLASELAGHDVKHVTDMRWTTIKNGKLLALAEQHFEVFLTVDRNLAFQQNIPKFRIAVLVVRAKSNRLTDLQPIVPRILSVLPQCVSGRVTTMS